MCLVTLASFCFALMEVSHKKPDSSLQEAKEVSSVGKTRKETLKMNCHCTEVETVINFCGAIVSSRNN